jgi:hypothetical protein
MVGRAPMGIIVMGAIVGCAATAALAVSNVPYDFFPLSYWVSPPTEDARYAELAECGFTLAFAGDMDLAWKYGMHSLVIANGLNAGGSSESNAAIDAAVGRYAGKPGFLGLILGDEPTSAEFPQLAHLNQRILARDPQAVPYINLNPIYAPLKWLGARTYEEYLEQFVTVVQPNVISFDHYALFTDGVRPDYYENLEIVRRVSLRHNIPFWYVLLATPLGPDREPAVGEPRLAGPYRDPTEGELRWQVYTSLAYGAQGLMYFTYFPPPPQPGIHFGDAIIRHDGTRDRKYWIVKQINAEVKALGQTLLQLTSTKVYHVGSSVQVPLGASGPSRGALVPAASAGHLVVGEFTNAKGARYVLLANASCSSPFDGDIVFSATVRALAEVPKMPGQAMAWHELPMGSCLRGRHLAAGDGRLYAAR